MRLYFYLFYQFYLTSSPLLARMVLSLLGHSLVVSRRSLDSQDAYLNLSGQSQSFGSLMPSQTQERGLQVFLPFPCPEVLDGFQSQRGWSRDSQRRSSLHCYQWTISILSYLQSPRACPGSLLQMLEAGTFLVPDPGVCGQQPSTVPLRAGIL